MLSGGFPIIKLENTVYCVVQPITALSFIKLLLLMMCYCVPVLVSLGCILFAVLYVVTVAERMLVCSIMGNVNVVPAVCEYYSMQIYYANSMYIVLCYRTTSG